METVNVFADPLSGIGHALWRAFTMFWQMLWALILGFTLSGVIQAVVSKAEMGRLLPNDSPPIHSQSLRFGSRVLPPARMQPLPWRDRFFAKAATLQPLWFFSLLLLI